MSRNLFWLDTPDILRTIVPVVPKVPNKYRVTADIKGFSPQSIKTEISDDKSKLVICGKEGESKEATDEDYNLREFRRSYKLPKNAETDKLVSFATPGGNLVVEIPLKEAEEVKGKKPDDLFPRLVEGEGGEKQLAIEMSFPESIDPSKIKVTCKDRDLIIQAEDRQEKPDRYSQTSYYRRTTLPENTDFKSLKCKFENNRLSISAPVSSEPFGERSIPIETGQEEKKKIESGGESQRQEFVETQKPSEQAQVEKPSEAKEQVEKPSETKEQEKTYAKVVEESKPETESKKQAEEKLQGKQKTQAEIPIENIPVERER